MFTIYKIEKKLCTSVIWSQNNKKIIQRHIQIIHVWMIGVIILINKHDLQKKKKLNKSNITDFKSWTWEANQYSCYWSHPPLNLHIIYVNVLFNSTKQAPKKTIVSSLVGQYQFIFIVHTTHNLFILDVPIHYIE